MHHHGGEHDGGLPDVPGEGRGPRGEGRGPRGEGRSRGFGPGRGFGGFGPGFGGPGFVGFGPGFGPGFGGGRVRKGNVRSAILSLLSQSSYNGYGIIKAIALHTDGAWRPSPGSVYPTLSALQAENLIAAVGEGRKTEFELTELGRAFVGEHSAEMAEVWEDVSEEAGVGVDLRQSLGKLMGAVQQVSLDSDEEKIKAATAALNEARRTIYQRLSD
ncbi:MAG: PadR family transcriptional regulator [Acidobacteria bacterium]|nr:PadR family transcriptional regulator [Acidobacteriota bacterium]